MEYLHLLDQTIELLKPVAPAGGAVVTHLAAGALWDWIKIKVKGRSPSATEAGMMFDRMEEEDGRLFLSPN